MPVTTPITTPIPVTTLPNLLVVGAQKSGTTALYQHLRRHPQIFLPMHKEPNYLAYCSGVRAFNGSLDSGELIRDETSYRALFASNDGRPCVGEASPNTMYFHRETIPTIRKLLGDPKIIISLRDPVARAYSAYRYLVCDGREQRSFEQMLALEDQMIEQQYEPLWHFRAVGLYSEQVEAVKSAFSNVMVILADDMQRDPTLSTRLCEFLEVDPMPAQTVIAESNASGVPRSPSLHRFLRDGIPFHRQLRRWLPADSRLRTLHRRMTRWNLDASPPINPETARQLRAYFTPDIRRLEGLIERDLSAWRG